MQRKHHDNPERARWNQRKYTNDDYSKYDEPGVSGKDQDRGTWINQSQYERQKDFIGKGPQGYKRSDERIYEDVCETLLDSPRVDASDIEVTVREGKVFLRGTVKDRPMKRDAEMVIEHVPGIQDIQNELTFTSTGEKS